MLQSWGFATATLHSTRSVMAIRLHNAFTGTGRAAAAATGVFAADTLLAPLDRWCCCLRLQAMALPLGRGEDVGTDRKQFTIAPLGNPLIEHVAASAALGSR